MNKLKATCILPVYLLPLLIVLLVGTNAEFHCQPGEWWNGRGECVPCTSCPEVVLRTCQPHLDAVCGYFHDIEINLIHASEGEDASDRELHTNEANWEWIEISLVVAAITSVVFVFAAVYLISVHRRQWNKMQQLDEELEQDIHRLMGKLAEVPNIQQTTAVLVDENQIKKEKGNIPFRLVYLEQLLGKGPKRLQKCGNVYTDRNKK